MTTGSLFRSWLRHRRIGFDTSFLIPLLEERQEKEGVITRLVRLVEKRHIFLLTSTVTLLEILVRPYQQGDESAVADYYGYLNQLPGVALTPVTSEIADRAAQLRAAYRFRTPDAIQLATAIEAEATLFLTRDRQFRKQKEIEVGVL